jgi:molybdenum cofactor biosynthesis enzyme MoaA
VKINTMSVVCGTTACNARCPFCVSHTTPCETLKTDDVNWRNLNIACQLAKGAGATTCLITGKGEPTLYPDLITFYLDHIKDTFPIIELQTNGLRIGGGELGDYLLQWYDLGLTTVCLSVVHWDEEKNKSIYNPHNKLAYPDLKNTIDMLHAFGYSVRLSVMLLKGYIDNREDADAMIDFALENKVEQLTMRPIVAPDKDKSKWNDTDKWIFDHRIDNPNHEWSRIVSFISQEGNKVLTLAHGAEVYDVRGQNVCLANCLTTNESDDNMRQIIFFPDGKISYDWCYEGARLL